MGKTLKWRTPMFMYHGIMAGLAAFTAYGSFPFWKSALIKGRDGRSAQAGLEQLGRITRVEDLPPRRVLVSHIREAMALNEAGVAVPRAPARPRARRLAQAVEWMAEGKPRNWKYLR